MAKGLPGKETSLWLDTTGKTSYSVLDKDTNTYDVVICGGGIAGILTAWYLEEEGLSVAIVEKDRLIQNTTGNTTAKLTSQHNLVYDHLINEHGYKTAQLYGAANEQAILDTKNLSEKLNIDCDFEPGEAYVFTQKAASLKLITKEVESAKSLGLPASFTTKTDLPFQIKGAVKFSYQAQFHPRKFLLGIAKSLAKRGTKIFENTKATDIKVGSPNIVVTEKGNLKANHVVVATKYPFWQEEIFNKNSWVKLSYALGITLKDKYPLDMYINFEDPIRTIRSHPYKTSRMLIFGGESHKMTKDYDKNEHWQNLINDVQKKFKVDQIIYRWIAGDVMPNDRLPHIGKYPDQKNIYIISGFHAWGLTWAMVAAQMIKSQMAEGGGGKIRPKTGK